MQTIRLGDVGTAVRGTIYDETDAILDVSTATTKSIIFRKPNGVTVTQTASFSTDGTDGRIQYVLLTGDIDQIGRWEIEVYVVMPSGKWYSSIGEFLVQNTL